MSGLVRAALLVLLAARLAAAARAQDPIVVANRRELAVDRIPCERVPLGEPDDYKPCIARLPDGELLVAAFHQYPKGGGKVLEQSLLFRSRDGGKTWSKPERLDLLGREPYLSVLEDGTIFLTGHLLASDVRNPYSYTCGFVHRSTDRGRTWKSLRIASEGVKPRASNHTSRNVLECADGSLLLGVDYDGGGGPYLTWRSLDTGETWDRDRPCAIEGFRSVYGFYGGETWLWQARSGRVWALARVDSNEMPIAGRPIRSRNDQSDHFRLYASDDLGRTFRFHGDFGDYGEMYMSLLRLGGGRLLMTFTVRDLKPPLGVRGLLGEEMADGFRFDFGHDRLMIDARTPAGRSQGGGFGPTVRLDDGTLVTSYSYRDAGDRTRLEVARWKLP
jgi:BNR repeat-like domain